MGKSILTPNELVLTFAVHTSVSNLVKIDKEMRLCDDTQTDRQSQTDFIICPMLYAIAMGQIKTHISIQEVCQIVIKVFDYILMHDIHFVALG